MPADFLKTEEFDEEFEEEDWGEEEEEWEEEEWGEEEEWVEEEEEW